MYGFEIPRQRRSPRSGFSSIRNAVTTARLGNDPLLPSTTTTSAPRPTASPFPTASTILTANRGFVASAPLTTPPIPAVNLLRWWQAEGLQHYPRARELLVQRRLRRQQLSASSLLHVCPPGTGVARSPQGRRLSLPRRRLQVESDRSSLFSEISKNWAGVPLTDYETILNHIRTTTTDTGLSCRRPACRTVIPDRRQDSRRRVCSIALQPHQTQPLRNYTICPRS